MASEPTAGEYRAVLEAVREALAIPHPATIGDEPAQRKVLAKRVMHVVVALDAVLGERVSDVEWYATHLRKQLATCPATGYRTWDEAVAERRARENAAAGVPGQPATEAP